MPDPAFAPDAEGLARAVALLAQTGPSPPLPARLPEEGLGGLGTLEALAGPALGEARRLGGPHSFDHMDPPTPWIAWATALWTAARNQNLLHPDTAPVARDLEARVIDWLAPAFGMQGGHMVPGSTIANLTGIWAARELARVRRVVASEAAHLSVAKAAHILGLGFEAVPADRSGALDPDALARVEGLGEACLVLTAGSTNAGAVDPLRLCGSAAWTHVDAAWAGPLRLTDHAVLLSGIEKADSVAISAHKWLYQPKESALVFFRDAAAAHGAISFGGAYLAAPNIGLLGSHGAMAVPLLATLMALGRRGLAERIERGMAAAQRLADWVSARPDATLFAAPSTGVVLWRPTRASGEAVRALCPPGSVSLTKLGGQTWLRNVAANPDLQIEPVLEAFGAALDTASADAPNSDLDP
ncbi:MAG: pyridoxal-dependent decarboxylase [Pseudomonadota bacterium]